MKNGINNIFLKRSKTTEKGSNRLKNAKKSQEASKSIKKAFLKLNFSKNGRKRRDVLLRLFNRQFKKKYSTFLELHKKTRLEP